MQIYMFSLVTEAAQIDTGYVLKSLAASQDAQRRLHGSGPPARCFHVGSPSAYGRGPGAASARLVIL